MYKFIKTTKVIAVMLAIGLAILVPSCVSKSSTESGSSSIVLVPFDFSEYLANVTLIEFIDNTNLLQRRFDTILDTLNDPNDFFTRAKLTALSYWLFYSYEIIALEVPQGPLKIQYEDRADSMKRLADRSLEMDSRQLSRQPVLVQDNYKTQYNTTFEYLNNGGLRP